MVTGGEVGRAGGGPARGGAKGWVWEARAEARKVAGSSVLGKRGPNWWFPEWPASGGARDGRRPCWARARNWALPFIGPEGGGGRARGELGASLLGKGRPGEARTAVAARPAMVVTVAGHGAGRACGELGSCQGRPGSSKPGARGWFWAEARRVGRPGGVCAGVRRRRGRGAGRTEVGEDGRGSFVNKSKFQNPVL